MSKICITLLMPCIFLHKTDRFSFSYFISELEAYSSVISALRAQGELTKERRKVMTDLSNVLNIPIERHKAEVRRAINEELLNTIAAR